MASIPLRPITVPRVRPQATMLNMRSLVRLQLAKKLNEGVDEFLTLSKREQTAFAYDDGRTLNETRDGFQSVPVELIVDVRLVGWVGDG